jgi:capsular polysaccharide biosynthesis protein
MTETTPPLRQAGRFLKRHAWLILLVPILAVAAASLVVRHQQKVYRASMGIVVAQSGVPYQPPLGNQALTQTMTSLLESDVVARDVVQKLQLKSSPAAILSHLHVAAKPDNSVLDVSYDSPRPPEALRILRQFGRSFEDLAQKELGVTTSFKKKPGQLAIVARIFSPPYLHSQPVSPRPAKTLGFAAALGLALGLILAFARESLDDRVRGPRDAEEWFEAPLIGTFPRAFRASPLGARNEQNAGGQNAVDALSANLLLGSRKLGPAVLVTSPAEERASAAIVARVGAALARAGQNVVCVATDFRHPDLQELMERRKNGKPERGLTDLLQGEVGIEEALHEVSFMPSSSNGGASADTPGRLLLLPLGTAPSEPTPFPSGQLSQLVAALSERASFVLFESPPLLSSPHALTLASVVDGVLLVARQGRTRREDAHAVRAALTEKGARNVALVLLDAQT